MAEDQFETPVAEPVVAPTVTSASAESYGETQPEPVPETVIPTEGSEVVEGAPVEPEGPGVAEGDTSAIVPNEPVGPVGVENGAPAETGWHQPTYKTSAWRRAVSYSKI